MKHQYSRADMSLSAAATCLRELSPVVGVPSEETAWERATEILLSSPATAKVAPARDWRPEGWDLPCPADVAKASLAQLIERLEQIPRGPQKAGVWKLLASWWVQNLGDSPDPEWSGALEDYRSALRGIRGLGPETVDRLLLVAAKQLVAPIDRGILRVLVRHGWADLPPDDESLQATFRTLAESDPLVLSNTVQQLRNVGHQFCGREPDCEACPLKPWLPPSGPISPDAC